MNVANILDFNQYGPQGERRQRQTVSLHEAITGFQNAMAEAGLGRPDIEADGAIHRFDLPDEKRGKKTGWYVLYPDNNPCPAGSFGSWKDDFSQSWHAAGANYNLSAPEQDLIDRRRRQAKAAKEEKRKQEHLAAARKLHSLYSRLQEASPETNPYLQRKQIGVFGGIRNLHGTLCVPMLDSDMHFAGMQFIAPEKPATGETDKKFGKNVDPRGLFNILPGDNATVYICEGYATGASIHQATGNTVVLAFSAGNILDVAKIIKSAGAYDGSRLVIAADDDRWNKPLANGAPNNPGQVKAKEACSKLGLSMVTPLFQDLSTHPTDFNDLHVLEGIEAVRLQLTSKNTGPKLADWDSMAAFAGEPPAREWLIRGVFPRGQVSLIAAAGGVGKSFMLLAMGRDIANTSLIRPAHFGGNLEVTGSTVYISAEDDHIEIHGRLNSLGGPVKGLYAVPLPNAGGAKPYFQAVEKNFAATDNWTALLAQLKTIKNLTTLIIDPIQPLCAMDLNMPEAAQTVCSILADAAASLNIAIIVAHHFRKSTVTNAEDARNAIRGTAGLVDGVRSVYALWQAPDGEAKKACKKLGLANKDDSIIFGCVVKGNSQKLSGVRKFVRMDHGVLVDHTDQLRDCVDDAVLLLALKGVIAEAAEDGKPYTKTGSNGVYERRSELPEPLCIMPKRKLWDPVDSLTDSKDVRTCSAKGSKVVKWLDITSGPFASGDGEFAPGFFESSQKSID